jgi:hypothetical protein
MTKVCDICNLPAEPMQGLYGAQGRGDHTGAKFGERRHYQCHIDKYGRHRFDALTRPIERLRQPMKKPNVTKGDYNRSDNASRSFKMFDVISEMGKRRGSIDCPFCNFRFTAYVWSIAGGGKKCPNCGAMHGSFGQAYPINGNEDL